MPNPVTVSYLLAAVAVPLVLHFHLLPAVFSGLAVHVLTVKLARKLPRHWTRVAHEVALAVIVVIVILGLIGTGMGIWSLLKGHHGMAALMAAVAETMDNLRRTLPSFITDSLPEGVDDLNEGLSVVLREHGQKISAAGVAGVKTFAHLLLGMVIGGMTALHLFKEPEAWPPLTAALHARLTGLTDAFDKVVFAQMKISALNTILTALYLLVGLPLFGVHLPLAMVLVILTFIVGLLPVVGNLISNAAIVLISLGVSPAVGLSSLIFLIVIHKLEYFTNAKIVGGEVHATAWELLCAMVAMEAVFGIVGLVAAPVVYAWLKSEIKAGGMI